MGKQTFCSICGHGHFSIYFCPYSKEIIKDPHHEIVCNKCGRGFVTFITPEQPNTSHTQLNQTIAK